MSTYLQLCQKMIRDLGTKNTLTTTVGQTGMNRKIVDWIADADEEIQTLWDDWNFLWSQHSVSTIVGIKEITKPTDLGTWDLDSFYLDYTSADYIHLTHDNYINWRQINRQGTQTNDEPSKVVLLPTNSLYLDPPPDAVYTFTADYWKAPTRMTVNSSTSPIPTRFERIIIARAKIYYAEHEEFPTVFELAAKEYQDLLNRLESAELPGKSMMRKSQNHDIQMVLRAE